MVYWVRVFREGAAPTYGGNEFGVKYFDTQRAASCLREVSSPLSTYSPPFDTQAYNRRLLILTLCDVSGVHEGGGAVCPKSSAEVRTL